MQGILLHLLATALYICLWLTCWHANERPNGSRMATTVVLCAALLSHALALGTDLFAAQHFHFGLSNALSITMWLAMMLYAVESTLTPLDGLLLFAAPVAAIATVMPAVLGGHPMVVPLSGWAFRLHIIVALMAYGLFTLAAFHALLMMAIERSLHHGNQPGSLRRLPPLLTMERLLFRLISSAFVLLTITIVSGLFFSPEIFGKPFALTHKSVFSILAWFVFGALLIGRHLYGWRGRTALRWTLSGLVLMLLAYVGSRFVLEFILGRSY